MIISNELKLISEATSLESINKIIIEYENATTDIAVTKDLLKIAYDKRSEILQEDVVYYPQDNTKNTFVVDASPEINKNFGSDKIGYFKLFDLKATPSINYMTSPCWRINVTTPSYETHYNSFQSKLNNKEKKQLIGILSMQYLDQFTKKQIKNNSIDPDYYEVCTILAEEYKKKEIVFPTEGSMPVYIWNILLYKINKVNNLINTKSAFPLLTDMPNYNLL